MVGVDEEPGTGTGRDHADLVRRCTAEAAGTAFLVLAVVAVIVVTGMMTFIVPIFVNVFKQMGAPLPRMMANDLYSKRITTLKTKCQLVKINKIHTNSIVANSDNVMFVLETARGWFERHGVRTGMVIQAESGPLVDALRPPTQR